MKSVRESDFGCTQAELAKALKVSRLTVSQLENDKRMLTPDMAFKYATLIDEANPKPRMKTLLETQVRHQIKAYFE